MTTYWAPLLHIYQPPTQNIEILRQIDAECYKPLFNIIDKFENSKFCLNISGVLIELLHEFGLADSIELLKNLVSDGKIEILGTAKYHPILPLIPLKEARHQIQINEELNRREFGNKWQRKGFFPPEMAISKEIIEIVSELGYKWIIMSGIACPVEWSFNKIYESSNGLKLYFRDDVLSNKIAFKQINAKDFVSSLKDLFKPPTNEEKNSKYIITAMDGETFGHHIKNYEKTFLGKVLDSLLEDQENEEDEDIQIIFISEIEKHFPISDKKITPRESSWSTSFEDFQNDIPYPLWKHPDNNIHKYYWKIMKSLNNLMNLAENLELTKDWEIEKYYRTARFFYDKGLYSCPLWWSNPQNGMWSPNLIYNGLELLLKAALNAQLALVYGGIEEAEGYFDAISYYHGLLLMELYYISKKNVKKNKI
jgi:alpha-amylase/alpha-mannosidase (GH57 family)